MTERPQVAEPKTPARATQEEQSSLRLWAWIAAFAPLLLIGLQIPMVVAHVVQFDAFVRPVGATRVAHIVTDLLTGVCLVAVLAIPAPMLAFEHMKRRTRTPRRGLRDPATVYAIVLVTTLLWLMRDPWNVY